MKIFTNTKARREFKTLPSFLLIVFLFSILGISGPVPIPKPSSSPTPSLSSQQIVSGPVPSIQEVVSPGEAAALLRAFEKRQISMQRSLQHQFETDTKNLKIAQKIKEKEFLSQEKETFMTLRKAGKSGQVIRDYVKERRERFKQLKEKQKNETKNLRDSQFNDRNQKSELRRQNRVGFEGYLRKGLKPPDNLWQQ